MPIALSLGGDLIPPCQKGELGLANARSQTLGEESHVALMVQAILAAPLGVNKLLDMMEDGREVIRNEAILLLLGLTRTSPDLQKIAAFQGAFPRLLHIVQCAPALPWMPPCACGAAHALLLLNERFLVLPRPPL